MYQLSSNVSMKQQTRQTNISERLLNSANKTRQANQETSVNEFTVIEMIYFIPSLFDHPILFT
jgi:hypothetical protein